MFSLSGLSLSIGGFAVAGTYPTRAKYQRFILTYAIAQVAGLCPAKKPCMYNRTFESRFYMCAYKLRLKNIYFFISGNMLGEKCREDIHQRKRVNV